MHTVNVRIDHIDTSIACRREVDFSVLDTYFGSRGVESVPMPNVPDAPVLADLPLITRGAQKGERWMTKVQFAAWCGVSVATVSDWVYTRRIVVSKQGTTKQARVRIASGERERLRPPVVTRSRRQGGSDAG